MAVLSVLMSAYNAEPYIAESIQSVLSQTFSDFDFIIVDDASTDRTCDVIAGFDDPRIRLLQTPTNLGVSGALQWGLNHVETSYFARMDADDLSLPTRLEKQLAFCLAHPEVAVTRCYVSFFPDNEAVGQSPFFALKKRLTEPRSNQPMDSGQIARTLYRYQCLINAATMMKTSVIKQFGWDPRLKMAEDYHLFYRMNRVGYLFDTVPEVLYRYRIVAGSASARNAHHFMDAIFRYVKHDDLTALAQSGNAYIWGTGGQASRLLELFQEEGLDVKGFVDFQPQKKDGFWLGKPVVPPSVLKVACDKVIIAAEPVMNQVADWLDGRGFREVIDYLVFV